MDDTDRDFLVAEELNADPFEGYLFEPEYSPAELRQRREQPPIQNIQNVHNL